MDLKSLVPFRGQGALTRPDFGVFGTLQREVDRLFDDFARGANANLLAPRIEVTESDKEIEISAELPGLERKDIDISLDRNLLTIRAEKKVEAEQKDKNVHMTERSYGVFYRVLELPMAVDPSSVQATMLNGVLKISLPKPARTEAKKIEVKEAA